MAETLVASGGVTSLKNLGAYEGKFAEGDHGRLDVSLRTGLPSSVVDGIGTAIKKAGVTLTEAPYQTASRLHIGFVKKIGALAIIAVAIAAAIVMVAIVMSWKLFKLSPVAAIVTGTVWLLVIGAIVVAAFMLFQKTKGG